MCNKMLLYSFLPGLPLDLAPLVMNYCWCSSAEFDPVCLRATSDPKPGGN